MAALLGSLKIHTSVPFNSLSPCFLFIFALDPVVIHSVGWESPTVSAREATVFHVFCEISGARCRHSSPLHLNITHHSILQFNLLKNSSVNESTQIDMYNIVLWRGKALLYISKFFYHHGGYCYHLSPILTLLVIAIPKDDGGKWFTKIWWRKMVY